MAELSLGAVVYALDLPNLHTFYRDVFQMRELHVEPEFVTLQTGDGVVTIVQAPPELVEEYGSSGQLERREGNPVKLSFPVNDIGTTRDRASEMGGSIDHPDSEWQFGVLRVCDGVDPEGNVIQVRQLFAQEPS